jgi:copper(I)-binding protein
MNEEERDPMIPIRSGLVAAALAVLATPAIAGSIAVEDAWARASAGMAKAGAAFLTVRNAGDAADKLIGAKSDVSSKTELHTHIKVGDVMQMRHVESIPIPAGGATMLKPGGDHVMFMGLNKPLVEGQTFPLTLIFEKAGEVTATVAVKGAGAMGPGAAMDHSKGHMKH